MKIVSVLHAVKKQPCNKNQNEVIDFCCLLHPFYNSHTFFIVASDTLV